MIASRHGAVPVGERILGYLPMSTHVVVRPDRVTVSGFVDATLVMPEDAPVPEDRQPALDATPGATYVWQPQRASAGPVAILVSGADRRMYVYRNGVRIGDAAVRISDPDTPLTPAVYTMLQPAGGAPTTPAAGPAGQRWMRVDLPAQAGAVQAGDFTQRVRVPKTFAADLAPLLVPGTTLMVTDRAATDETRSAPGFVVVEASPLSS